MKKTGLASTLCFIILCAVFASCSRNVQITNVELPPTQVLEQNTNFAVITSSHLRLREEPSVKAKAVTTLWKGYILEIISKSGKKETVEDQENYWYFINYDGLKGWIFGAYVKVFPSLEEAREEAKSGQQN